MPNVTLIDPAEEAARQTAIIIQQSNLTALQTVSKERQIECCVTDLTPTFIQLVSQFLGVSSEAVRHVSIEHS